jgi:hypothetical protein
MEQCCPFCADLESAWHNIEALSIFMSASSAAGCLPVAFCYTNHPSLCQIALVASLCACETHMAAAALRHPCLPKVQADFEECLSSQPGEVSHRGAEHERVLRVHVQSYQVCIAGEAVEFSI